MALVPCRECNKEISDKAAACPHCGMPMHPQVARKVPAAQEQTLPGNEGVSIWVWVVSVPVVCIAIAAAAGAFTLSEEDEEQWRNSKAIELCWEEQSRKSITPGEARFIAGACEKMERDYKAKWGRNP